MRRHPPPTTVCQGSGRAVVVTVNPNQPPVTETNLVYETSHLAGTVWVGYVLVPSSVLRVLYPPTVPVLAFVNMVRTSFSPSSLVNPS